MFDWITHLLHSGNAAESTVDKELLFQLREELNECEALYRTGAHVCLQICPETIDGDPGKFLDLMIDLHRGLLIKIFVEVSDCERHWHPEEGELALELLHHVWGARIPRKDLLHVLHNVAELDATLKWESVLGPFRRVSELAEHTPELKTCIMRISNLVAKANGRVLPSEAARLRSIQAHVERNLSAEVGPTPTAAPGLAHAGARVAQVLPKHRHPQSANASRRRSSAAPGESPPPIDVKTPQQLLAEAMAELNQLIGLDLLKQEIHQLVNFLKVQHKRQSLDLPRTQLSLHTVFLGNPGTGKTTVARILARIFAGLRILRRGHTVETDRAGLVAEYAGQTAPKVNKRVDDSLDGILFVDEAYSLIAERGDDPYGNEAVQVLLKRMEDERGRLVVVLAGYPRPMATLLDSNPGLRSRFQRLFHFPDYNADELLQIFLFMCSKGEYALTDAARDKLRAAFQAQFDERDECFGNGRLARNVFERAIERMANRIVDVAPITRPLLTTLEADDIDADDPSSSADADNKRGLSSAHPSETGDHREIGRGGGRGGGGKYDDVSEVFGNDMS